MDALRETPIIFTNVKKHLDTLEVKELIVQAATSSDELLVFLFDSQGWTHMQSQLISVTFWFAKHSELQELHWQR